MICAVIAVLPPVLHRCRRAAAGWLAVALLLAQAGCATLPPGTTRPSPDAEPPAPNVNLSGFPLPYRQGYADGCASAGGGERKDAARFAADGNYRTGWQDGRAICARK